jgi:hypothetical protein
VIERNEHLVVTSVLYPEAGQFVGPGVLVKLYDPAMAAEGTPVVKEWLDNEYIWLSPEETSQRRSDWNNQVCEMKQAVGSAPLPVSV